MKTALIIGDSHVDPSGGMPFGADLKKRLEQQGYTVTQAGVGATNAHQWAHQANVCNNNGRCVDQHTLPHRPDLLVISLGTNDAANALAGGQSMAASVADVQRIIQQYAPGQVFWVGPPATRQGTAYTYYTNAGVAQYYAAADAADVAIFDSRPVTKPYVDAGSGDGVHLGPQGGAAWADAVAKAIASPSNWKTIAVVGSIVVATSGIVWWLKQRVLR
jgi:lysophospholipase L1-like esterase